MIFWQVIFWVLTNYFLFLSCHRGSRPVILFKVFGPPKRSSNRIVLKIVGSYVTGHNFSVSQMWNKRKFKNQKELDKEFGPILLNIELFFVIYLCDFRAGAFDRWLYNGLKYFQIKHFHIDKSQFGYGVFLWPSLYDC